MKLVDIVSLIPEYELSIWDVIDEIKKILETWQVSCIKPIEKRVVNKDLVVYWALKRLDTKYVPVCEEQEETEVSLEDLGFYDNIIGDQTRVFYNVVDAIARSGPTPLVKLEDFSTHKVRVWAKLEWYWPCSLSLKDRIAYHMVKDLQSRGLTNGKILIDASSGNFAVSLRALSRWFGYNTRIYAPARPGRFGKYSKLFLELTKTEIVPMDVGTTVEAISRVLEEGAKESNVVIASQLTNDMNFEAHLKTMAKEIDFQAKAHNLNLVAIAGPLGTSGHMAALNFYFRSKFKGKVKTIMAQPAKDDHIPGIRRVETGMKWLEAIGEDYTIIDVTSLEAMRYLEKLAESDGILPGPTSGAALAALMKYLESSEGKKLEGDAVVVFPDHGFKYIEWIETKLKSLRGEENQ
ncbi:MAG: pyridoxal-phosphate dependent enzyme [Acidilobaceae archaeon]